jgi:hypothetical protein
VLVVTGRKCELTRLWAGALEHVIVRHPNRGITPRLTLDDSTSPVIYFELDQNPSSNSDEIISPFIITNVMLTFFPGIEAARAWLAAAWACFLQHEALELVTIGDFMTRALDPHQSREALNHVFHTGLPSHLTPESLRAALLTAIPAHDVDALLARSKESP